MHRPNVFDLFAGCGGLSLGLEQAGLNVCWANENWAEAAATYKSSHPNSLVFEEDSQNLFKRLCCNEKDLPKPGDVDLVVGGPPCQGFSGYNRYSSPNDPRNSMVDVFLDFVRKLEPPFVLMENVPGMLSMSDGEVGRSILDTFRDLGYATRLGILQAGNYGLPQNRWRVFILAAISGVTLPKFPAPTHEFTRTTVFGAKHFRNSILKAPKQRDLFWDAIPSATVRDAIGDLPPIDNGGGDEISEYLKKPEGIYQRNLRNGSNDIVNHVCSNMGPIMIERIRAVPKRPGAGWLDLPKHLQPKNLAKHGDRRYNNRFGRLHWEGIFNTILSMPFPYWGRVIHPEQDRVLSARECARAQSFPDVISFKGKLKDQYKQIGNAVPPILGKVLGLSILEAMTNSGKK